MSAPTDDAAACRKIELMREAERLLAADRKKALRLARQAVTLLPNDVRAWNLSAEKREFDRALARLEPAIDEAQTCGKEGSE